MASMKGLFERAVPNHTVMGPVSAVEGLYQGLLGRAADDVGLRHHLDALASGQVSFSDIVAEFVSSPEFQARHDRSGGPVLEDRPTLGCSDLEAMQVFSLFERYTGPGRAGFITNFLGGLTDTRFVGFESHSGRVEGYPIPRNFHSEALEWVGTLRAVQDASDTFRMIELGAGWAPFCTIGYLAATQRGLRPEVMAVEGDLGHIGFIEQSFATNGHDPDRCTIRHGIVGAADGTASFPRSKDASKVYGGAASFSADIGTDEPFQKLIQHHAALFEEVDILECYSLARLLDDFGRVDLIHCDIQGAEAEVFEANIASVSENVAWLVVGTHSFDIDRRLATLFPRHGWQLEGMDCALMRNEGGIAQMAADGTQIWKNMRR